MIVAGGIFVERMGAAAPPASTFTQTSGHRIIRFVFAQTGKLPSDWTSVAAVQTSLNAAFPGQYSVVSVVYPAPALPGSGASDTVEITTDYTGPTKEFSQDTTVTDSGIVVTTYLQDAGPIPANSGTKTALIVGGAIVATALAAVGARAAGWI